MKKLIFFVLLCYISMDIYAQNTRQGEINGYITHENGTIMKRVLLHLEKEGSIIARTNTDTTGYYSFTFLSPGEYFIIIKPLNTKSFKSKSIRLLSEEPSKFDIIYSAEGNSVLDTHVVKRNRRTKGPRGGGDICIVVDLNNTHVGPLVSSYINLAGGFNSTPQGVSVGGQRPNGNLGQLNGRRFNQDGVISSTLDQIELSTGGISVRYGDFTGGLTSMITQSASAFHKGSLQYLTSTGLDGRNYNHIEGAFRGPLIKKKESIILGYNIAANYIYNKDPNPSSIGYARLKSDVANQIQQHPYIVTKNGLENATNNITSNDWERTKWNLGDGKTIANLFSALEWNPTKKIMLNGEFTYMNTQSRQVSLYNSMFNNANQALVNNNQLTATFRFNHILVLGDTSNKSRFKNAWYNFRIDYNSQWSETMDETHGRNFFDYGYLGKYESKRNNQYILRNLSTPKEFKTKTPDGKRDTTIYMSVYFEQIDDSISSFNFIASDKNKTRSNYTTDVLNFYGNDIRNSTQLTSKGGLLNGDNPVSVNSLFAASGSIVSGYAKSNVDLLNIGTEAGVKIMGKGNSFHDIILGMQYEQRTYRSYNLNATNLWTLMRNLSHQADPVLDQSKPIVIYDENGNLLDTIKYQTTIESLSRNHFTESLRNRLIANGIKDENGNIYQNNSRIEPDRLDPSMFRLEDFSADELLNGGKSSLVNYYGYDYLGNKLRKKTSMNDFLNNDKRNVGAFRPIYTSFYIQDRFNLRDFSLQAGVRVENYDANQSVLKDPYSLYPTKTVRDVKAENAALSQQINPNISDDAVVYVNDINSPTSITGYRVNKSNNQAQWFDKNGGNISNPDLLAHETSNGRIAPYLVNPNKQVLTVDAFKDYKAQWNILPRVWFKFPITSEAIIFAHYDVYAQRPPEGVIATIDDYYFLPQRSNEIINNPALKPLKRTDYELGLRHKIGKNSLLSFITSYSEVRNLIQVTRFNQAYPVSYTTFGNLDFSTVKSLRVEYNSTGEHLGIISSYSMQFADGTGSNALSSSSLVNSGQPNLRNIYPLDYDLRHVIKANLEWHFNSGEGLVGKKPIFENSGINISLQARSGLPYTRISFPVNTVQEGIANRTMMAGSINGSRMPWNLNADIYLFKNIKLKTIKDSLNPIHEMRINSRRLNVFLWVQNVLNIKNTQQVYQYTGSATDDGYINSEWGKQTLKNEQNAKSFSDLYNAKLLNPGNFGIPHLFQIGIKYTY
jgi:hypothetical protein